MSLLRIQGIGASPGIGRGRAYLRGTPTPRRRFTQRNGHCVADRPAELARLRQAIAEAAAQLEQVRAETGRRIGASEAAVFEAQTLLLQDPSLLDPTEAQILDDGRLAADAVEAVFEQSASALAALEDPYLRARASDVRDVKERLLRLLLGEASPNLSALDADSVIVAQDLTPSDTAALHPDRVAGIVLAGGTPTAHAAILARGLGLPLVLGAGEAIWRVQPGQTMLLDGTDGTVLVEPDADEWTAYQGRFDAFQAAQASLRDRQHGPVETRDGQRIILAANASTPAEARQALENGAEGIGLLRTEFLLAMLPSLGGLPPGEDELAEAYGAVLGVMGNRPVIVRALDAGGDKPPPFIDFGREANPFLGWRGIRVLLDRQDLLIAQTRALLLAAAEHHTDLRLMFPMVSDPGEFQRARHTIETACGSEIARLAHPLQIGVMIEVPSAALLADLLARQADFFSLGTNDLVQYTLARDRGNARVGGAAQFAHPAVLRLVDLVVRAAHQAGRQVGVCGEAAGDPLSARLLIGLGVDELSVSAARLPALRQEIRSIDAAQARDLASRALGMDTVEQVHAMLA